MASDYCRDCYLFTRIPKTELKTGMAYCGGYNDTIARNAKGANHCKKRLPKDYTNHKKRW